MMSRRASRSSRGSRPMGSSPAAVGTPMARHFRMPVDVPQGMGSSITPARKAPAPCQADDLLGRHVAVAKVVDAQRHVQPRLAHRLGHLGHQGDALVRHSLPEPRARRRPAPPQGYSSNAGWPVSVSSPAMRMRGPMSNLMNVSPSRLRPGRARRRPPASAPPASACRRRHAPGRGTCRIGTGSRAPYTLPTRSHRAGSGPRPPSRPQLPKRFMARKIMSTLQEFCPGAYS